MACRDGSQVAARAIVRNKNRRRDERNGIQRGDPVKDATQELRSPARQHHTGRYSAENGPRVLAEDQSENVAIGGADRHSDSDLAGAKGYDIADGAVNPDRREQEAQEADAGGNRCRKAGSEKGIGLTQHLLQCRRRGNNVGIQASDRQC